MDIQVEELEDERIELGSRENMSGVTLRDSMESKSKSMDKQVLIPTIDVFRTTLRYCRSLQVSAGAEVQRRLSPSPCKVRMVRHLQGGVPAVVSRHLTRAYDDQKNMLGYFGHPKHQSQLLSAAAHDFTSPKLSCRTMQAPRHS